MINAKDLYCCSAVEPIASIGQSIIQYEVHRYRDVRSLSDTLAYLVICTHRIVIPNGTPYQVGANTSAFTSFSNYPAVITSSIGVAASPGTDSYSVTLKEIFPRTLNANISTSLETQSSANSTSSNQQASGSSNSQSNSFGVSLSGGFFGELPVGNLAVDYQHSWGSGTFDSATTGTGTGRQAGSSGGETMSIKDWSSYGQVSADGRTSTWVWGQSYPWDPILYNQSQDGTTIIMPPFVQSRMMTTITSGTPTNPIYTTFALAPSQLSLFGLDFTMKASWLIEFPSGVTVPETAVLTHALDYYTATHSVDGSGPDAALSVTINPSTPWSFTSPPLDLSTYALDPILNIRSGGAVNFTSPALFAYPPSEPGGAFKILSSANNLQVTGSGFEPDMTTSFGSAVKLNVQFKILDVTEEYSLLLHHWINSSDRPVTLSLTVNGNPPISLFVDATEGMGGQNNIGAIALRDLNFSAISFHDFLQLGLNVIEIEVAPMNASGTTTYCLSALAVGQA